MIIIILIISFLHTVTFNTQTTQKTRTVWKITWHGMYMKTMSRQQCIQINRHCWTTWKKSKISSLGAMWYYELSPLQPWVPRRVPSYSQDLPRGILFYSQGCHAGSLLTARGATRVSILHRLSWLLAAATRVLTRLLGPSNVASSERVKGDPMRRYNIHFIVYLQNCIR